MQAIIQQFLPQLKSNEISWTELANVLLDFDIEISKIEPIRYAGRNGKERLALDITFADRASDFEMKLTVEC